MSMKDNVIQILWEKTSPIWEMIINNIDLFDENELRQIYLMIHQTDVEKLKELFLYQNSQAKALLDRIINIARELNHAEKNIEIEDISQKDIHLEKFITENLDLYYSIS